MKTIVLCSALPLEIQPLIKLLSAKGPTSKAPIIGPLVFQQYQLYCLASGIGYKNMNTGLKSLPVDHVDLWLSVGFAGALVPGLNWGECYWGNNFINSKGSQTNFTNPWQIDDTYQQKPLACASKMLTTPQQKQQLHTKTRAILVDMESAAVAKHALNRSEPCLWMRTISDTLHQTLPNDLDTCMTPQGYPSTLRFAKKLVQSPPHEIVQLLKMGLDSKKLSQRLAHFVVNKLKSSYFSST